MKKMRLFLAAVIAMSTVALYSCGGGANTEAQDTTAKKDSAVKVEAPTTTPTASTDASTGSATPQQ